MDDDEPIAVALKYNRSEDKAPRVIAKGTKLRADQIRAIAKQNDIPIMKNVALAHALNRVDVGDEIPDELYDAVAEVLNFVYALTGSEGSTNEPK